MPVFFRTLKRLQVLKSYFHWICRARVSDGGAVAEAARCVGRAEATKREAGEGGMIGVK
jgi:hypothetical protein